MNVRAQASVALVTLLLLSLVACGGQGLGPAPTPTPTPPPSPFPTPAPAPTPPAPSPAPIPGTGGISGTVSSSFDLLGTFIAACFSESCDPSIDGNSGGTQITTSGTSAAYSIPVNAGQYLVIAIQDTNQSGALDAGDYIGAYPSLEGAAAVTAPASGINLSLVPYTGAAGTRAPLLAAPAWEQLTHHAEESSAATRTR